MKKIYFPHNDRIVCAERNCSLDVTAISIGWVTA